MNRRLILSYIGRLLQTEALLLLLPLITAIIYGEDCVPAFALVAGGAALVGSLLTVFFKPKGRVMYAREGFVTVAAAWVVLSLVGALPFVISGEIPSFADAFFETVSGFTTTGSSIVTDVESLSRGALMWRAFTHWVGGMGVLVFIMAIMPLDSIGTMHIARAEMPGPVVDKIVPKLKNTARVLYLIYIGLTLAEIIFLVCGEMDLFEALFHSFGTAGTGGFSMKADGLASYSPYSQWVITIFMLIFGVNFNIYYLVLLGQFRQVWKNTELRAYLGIVLGAVVLVCINIFRLYASVGESIRHAAFQVASIITTTGFATTDFDKWGALSKAVLFTLMFIGGCAGSTAGGLKVCRVALAFKSMRRDLRKRLHPRTAAIVKMDGKRASEDLVSGTMQYIGLYFALFFIFLIIVCFEPFSFETNISAVATCLNNVGPGFAAVGPMASFAQYSGFTKIVLSVAMLLGRLEIYPLLLAFAPSTWTKK